MPREEEGNSRRGRKGKDGESARIAWTRIERMEARRKEKRRKEGVGRRGENGCARERRDFSPGGSLEVRGDLPSRAKPLINAFAKKLHAVGGKQEQEGVGRARSNTRDLCRFLPLADSLPFAVPFFSYPPAPFHLRLPIYSISVSLFTRRKPCEPPQPIRSRFWSR